MILHLELFCRLRGKFRRGARIPKIEFIVKYKDDKEGIYKYLMGLDKLEGTAKDFFKDKKIKAIEKVKAIKSISELIKNLQDKFEFMIVIYIQKILCIKT